MARPRAQDIRQILKWVVYTLLTINFVFYFLEELKFAEYTIGDGVKFLEWTAAFATTRDEIAWLVPIALFELETYALSDEVSESPGRNRHS